MKNNHKHTVLAGITVDIAVRNWLWLKLNVTVLSLLVAAMLLFLTPVCLAEVEGNCTMCHKYPGFGRIEESEDGKARLVKRLFYINNPLFESTYHGKIRCKSCHTGVDKLPHTNAPAVDCATDCHIMDPSNNKPFPHRKIVDDFNESVHGKQGSQTKDKGDLPVCKDCHSNKTYHDFIAEQMNSNNKIMVCQECHESKEFVKRFYEHIIYRTTKRRPSKEVIKLCSTCHADQELMQKADLDMVVGFTSTFHAKAIKFGNEEVANCLNCHAPYELGFSPHRITSSREKHSPVSIENRIKTCRQSECHTDASEAFAVGSRVHPSPDKIKYVATNEVEKKQQTRLIDDPTFQTRVVGWIQLFYKVLIVVVIGGLGMHRILDMYAHNREQRARRSQS